MRPGKPQTRPGGDVLAQASMARDGATQARRRQRGQAVLEALLAAAALGVCAYAIAWTGRLQHQALAVSQDSRVAAFTAARGAPPSTPGQASRLLGSRVAAAPDAETDTRLGQLADEWLRVDSRLLRMQAERGVTPGIGLERGAALGALDAFDALDRRGRTARAAAAASRAANEAGTTYVLRRYTVLAEGAGHAATDRAGQQRIAEGQLGWRRVAGDSQRLSRTLRQRIGTVDAAWGGRQPGEDWTSAWADLVPAERMPPARRH